jgi:hypothetical protein
LSQEDRLRWIERMRSGDVEEIQSQWKFRLQRLVHEVLFYSFAILSTDIFIRGLIELFSKARLGHVAQVLLQGVLWWRFRHCWIEHWTENAINASGLPIF